MASERFLDMQTDNHSVSFHVRGHIWWVVFQLPISLEMYQVYMHVEKGDSKIIHNEKVLDTSFTRNSFTMYSHVVAN